MTTLLATLVNGAVLGLMYGLLAIALLLLFQTTGVLNFAQADVGMFLTFLVFGILGATQIATGWGIAIGVLLACAMGLVLYLLLVRSRPAIALDLSLRTLGLFLLFAALAEKVWGSDAPYRFPAIVPDRSVIIAGYSVLATQIVAAVFALVVAGAVGLLMRRTRVGLLIRAMRSDREIAMDLGVNVDAIDTLAWIASTVVALVVAIMVATLTFLSPTMMGPFFLAAFAAAMLGGLHSMVGALVAGLALGVVQSTTAVYLNEPSWSQIFAFLILLGGLIIRERSGQSMTARL